MKVLESKFAKGFIRMADDGWQLRYHERNGGNLSYRIRPEEIEEVKENLTEGEWREIGATAKDVAGEYFMVTGSGKFFRNVSIQPEEAAGIIEVSEDGSRYRIVWGLINGAVPTSELPSHLLNQSVKKRVTNGKNRVIYHAHPANVIALTFILPLDEKIFTRELWEMMTECPIVFPEGIGVVPWMVPGGREIAEASSKLMEDHNAVIWAHHGLFAAGEDFDLTFGLFHTIEKSAEILLKVMNVTDRKRQTIQPDDFRKLAKAFNIELPEKYLYDKE